MSTWSMNGLTAGMVSIRFETKYLRLRTPVTIGSRFGEWEVCWLGGWTSHKLSYIVMTARVPRKTTLENRVRIVKALQRRLQRLERHGHDSSGLVPHTQEWHEYWHEGICAYASDDYQGARRALSAEPLLNRNSFIGAPSLLFCKPS